LEGAAMARLREHSSTIIPDRVLIISFTILPPWCSAMSRHLSSRITQSPCH
jgi:hypothetical protein